MSNFFFKKQLRLRSSRQFKDIAVHGKKCAGKYLFIQYIKQEGNSRPKLGLTVSRHFGKSHERNRFKRIVREAFRLNFAVLPPVHLNIKPRKEALCVSMKEIQEELLRLLNF